jgi:hypothetical protein
VFRAASLAAEGARDAMEELQPLRLRARWRRSSEGFLESESVFKAVAGKLLTFAWALSWLAYFGGLVAASVWRPNHPDPIHGYTEMIKTYSGLTYLSPTEKLLQDYSFGIVFAMNLLLIAAGFVSRGRKIDQAN